MESIQANYRFRDLLNAKGERIMLENFDYVDYMPTQYIKGMLNILTNGAKTQWKCNLFVYSIVYGTIWYFYLSNEQANKNIEPKGNK